MINSQTLAIKCIAGTSLWETAQENQTGVKRFWYCRCNSILHRFLDGFKHFIAT